MARVILVRHGEAAAGWGDDVDPGLSALGRAQADAVAEVLGPTGPLTVLSSPLRRARETAEPLAARWGAPIGIEPRVGEIQNPTVDLAGRSAWLHDVMSGRWMDQDVTLRRWVDELVGFVVGLRTDTVVFSHFVAINAVIGRATDDDRVLVARLGNGSRTVLDVDGTSLRLVEAGVEVPATDVL